jgi:hypothetical protein
MKSRDGLRELRVSKPRVRRWGAPEGELGMQPDIPQIGPEGGRVQPELEAAIQRARSGQPLESALREQMGASLGCDFSEVRVHTGPEADQLNRRLGARAFTLGSDIFFQRGAYDPASSGGRGLIAHELIHVVQQSTGRVGGSGSGITVRPAGDAFEQEADALARLVATAGPGAAARACAEGLRRQGVRAERAHPVAARRETRPLVIQRTREQIVRYARRHPEAGVTCHEAAVEWLLRSSGYRWAAQLVRRLKLDVGYIGGNWLRDNVYATRLSVSRSTLAGLVEAGDLLFVGSPNLINHSLVVVENANGVVSVRGFNNTATLGTGLPYQYDDEDREILPGPARDGYQIWHSGGSRFGLSPGSPVYRVKYENAGNRLRDALNAEGWRHHWRKGWVKG